MWKTLAHEMLKQGAFLALHQTLTTEHPFLTVRHSSLQNTVILHLRNRPDSKHSSVGTERAWLRLLRSTEPSVKSYQGATSVAFTTAIPPVQVSCSVHVTRRSNTCDKWTKTLSHQQSSRACTGDMYMPLDPVMTTASVNKASRSPHSFPGHSHFPNCFRS